MDHIKEETDARHLDDVDITNMEKQPQQVQVAPSDQVHIRRMVRRDSLFHWQWLNGSVRPPGLAYCVHSIHPVVLGSRYLCQSTVIPQNLTWQETSAMRRLLA
jgi:hypothetical protein